MHACSYSRPRWSLGRSQVLSDRQTRMVHAAVQHSAASCDMARQRR